MNEIKHTGKWPEPICLATRRGKATAYRNLLVGESTQVLDAEISPEIRILEKRGYITVTPVSYSETTSTPAPVVANTDFESSSMDSVDMTTAEIAALEKELLSEDGPDAVSNEEA